MAESYNLVRNVHFPRRTVSLSARLPSSNPLEIVSELKSIRASVSVAPPCPRTIESYLGKLAEMYEVVGEIAVSLTGRNGKATVEGAVDDVILLLDVCGYARDMVSSTKLEVRDLQSVLRRKSSSGIIVVVEVERQVKSFVRFRKNTRRAMSKHLDRLKRLERKNSVVAARFTNMEDEHSATVRESLRDLCGITFTILRSLLVLFCPSPTGRGSHWWSFLSRLVLSTGRGKQRSSAALNAAEGVDSPVFSLTRNRTGREAGGFEEVIRVQRVLEEMISNCILGLEEGLDCLHVNLIRHRVCLLNLLTN